MDQRAANKTMVVTIIVSGIFIFVLIGISTYRESLPRHPKRTVAMTTNFEQLWHLDGVMGVPNRRSKFNPDSYIFLYKNGINRTEAVFNLDLYLRTVDIVTGREIWHAESTGQLLEHNSDTAFTFSSQENRMRVTAYDALTGEIIWEKTIDQMAHIWGGVHANKDVISIVGAGQKALSVTEISLNIEDGKEIPFRDIRSSGTFYRWRDEVLSSKIDMEDIVHASIAENYIFAMMTGDSSIWAFDRQSGEAVGSVTFDQLPVTYGRSHSDFDLQYLDGYLVVYFGDSQQLFAFEFTPSLEDE